MSALFDTHCHYNLEPLYQNWREHWRASQAKGVTKSLLVGVDQLSNQRAIEIAEQESGFYAAVGFHPTDIDQKLFANLDAELEQLSQLISSSDKVIAVGETGLDYFRLPEDSSRESVIKNQKQIFIRQIELANHHNLPVIIHVRDKTEQAYWEVLELLKNHWKSQKPFILHCASGPLQYIKVACELGGYIGIAGNVTYKNADAIRAIVKATPPDRLLLETDSPFLPPQQYRGQICEPWMIAITAEYLQGEFGVDLEQVYVNSAVLFAGS